MWLSPSYLRSRRHLGLHTSPIVCSRGMIWVVFALLADTIGDCDGIFLPAEERTGIMAGRTGLRQAASYHRAPWINLLANSLFFRGLLAALLWLSIGVVAMNALPSWADTIEWTDPNNGNFNDPNKWTVTSGAGSPPPVAGDVVELNEEGAYTVTFTQNEASDQFNVRNGDVSFVSDSATLREYTIATGGADALVRDGGTLTIGSDPNRPVFVNVGDIMNIGTGTGDGAVTVSGANSRLDVLGSGLSDVGSSGRIGSLTITDGATANYGMNGTFRIGVSGNAATLGHHPGR